jgi:hypothetical protein
MNTIQRHIVFFVFSVLSISSIAGTVTVPNNFSAGTPARAAEVNANFTAVKTAVDDNDGRLTTVESYIKSAGTNNISLGVNAGNLTMTGQLNTATGASAFPANSTGNENTTVGAFALLNNTTGSANTAIGTGALQNNEGGSGNIAVGHFSGSAWINSSNNIAVGHVGVTGELSTIRIGNSSHEFAFIAGIRGTTTTNADAVPVMIDSAGQLGTVNSSRRVKDHIADMGSASGVLKQLRPVTFYYKSDQNPEGRSLQYGLVAEEVAKVEPGLVAHSANGAIETVYYQFLTPMLLNEYQKQQRMIEAQTTRLEQQATEIAELKQQMARMTKLLARLELPETVASVNQTGALDFLN